MLPIFMIHVYHFLEVDECSKILPLLTKPSAYFKMFGETISNISISIFTMLMIFIHNLHYTCMHTYTPMTTTIDLKSRTVRSLWCSIFFLIYLQEVYTFGLGKLIDGIMNYVSCLQTVQHPQTLGPNTHKR